VLAVTALLAACSPAGDPQASPSASPSPSESPSSSATPTPQKPEALETTFFGSHDHDPVATWPDGPVGSLRAWDAGVTWKEIETTPGQYDFTRLDAMVDTAEQNGADVLLVLGQTPAFHAVDPAAASFYGEGASSPPKMAAWTAYVQAVAERYAGRPVVLQVWNEANVAGFWSGTQQEMADLTKAAYDVVEGIDPRPQLVSPALVTRLSGQRSWINAFYATSVEGRPVADYVDAVSLQLYPAADGTPESSMKLLTAMKTVLASHGVDKPIWNTEINYGLTGQEVEAAPVEEQQSNVVRTYVLNAANAIRRVYWYGWDQQSIVDTLLTEPDLSTLTPAGRAYRTAQKWLLGATVTGCTEDADRTWTCTLDSPEGASTVYWNPRRTVQVTPPEGATRSQRVGEPREDVAPGATLEVGLLPVRVEQTG
jgi:GH35 family endo-1,4-beta-xylanase